ncbi:MAG TPA: FtsW/RodA/SpoVE family cell cycle protein, partial [Casimicrobiaceae bacterium]|nr:FtsW/RodA/SpoVE family cell cycle protein [Casimicrobiaceae bacterium]
AAAPALARAAVLPDARMRAGPCADVTPRDALEQAAALVADARAARLHAAKSDAVRALLPAAGGQWAAAMLVTLVLVKLSRTRMRASVGCGLAMLAWAAAAWAGRVPWPLAQDATLDLGRVGAAWDAWPAPFVLALAGAGLACVAAGALTRRPRVPPPQTLASRAGLAGFIVATGVGWIVLLDLSAHGPPSNRYLALYHQGHLWLALLVLTVVAFLRPALGRGLAALLAIVDEIAGRIGRSLGPAGGAAVLALAIVAIVTAIGLLLSGVRQFTSELGRVWLVVGVAWFFFLRGGAVAERLARDAPPLASLLRYAWPLAFVALVLAGAMVVTRDMGPLLIACYAAGAFLAATIAMWWHVRTRAVVVPSITAIALFALWIAGVTQMLFAFGALDEVTAGRLENLAAPLASANDQLALVTWFRDAVPPGGFGPGAVPWCGFASGAGCSGVPAQIQSDYTFTALVGMFGHAAAWGLALGAALWLHRLIAHHGHVTRGEPRLVRRGGRIVADPQAFLSWIGVAWVVLALCQLAVTVAGNLAVLPLTGVTFPFVSFGMTSLVVNCALLALCINVTVPGAAGA